MEAKLAKYKNYIREYMILKIERKKGNISEIKKEASVEEKEKDKDKMEKLKE